MIKKLAGLLLAVSTTASAQFVVEEKSDIYYFDKGLPTFISDTSKLKIGDIFYSKELDFCISNKNKLNLIIHHFIGNINKHQNKEHDFKIKLIGDYTVAIESLKEQDGLIVNGPAVEILKQLRKGTNKKPKQCFQNDSSTTTSNYTPKSIFKVGSMFGYVSYEGLAKGILKDLEERNKDNGILMMREMMPREITLVELPPIEE